MAAVIRFNQPGDSSVLWEDTVVEQAPGEGQAWLQQAAVGVNYLDVTQRNGAVKAP
jgi:NADPH2:quinone reductase